MKTGIVIPCYNESTRLNTKAFLSFAKTHTNYHLCFVNDGSKDDTLAVLKELQQKHPINISVIHMKENGGKAEAVRAGAQYLYSRGDISYTGFMDADLSTDFADFKDLVKTLKSDEKLGFVFGSRALETSKNIEKNPFRALISKLINLLIIAIIGIYIKDTQCGAKIFKTSLTPILFERNFKSRWLFDVEMFLRLKQHFGKSSTKNMILEKSLHRWVHMDDSKLTFKDGVLIPFQLLTIWTSYNLSYSSSSYVYTKSRVDIIESSVQTLAA